MQRYRARIRKRTENESIEDRTERLKLEKEKRRKYLEQKDSLGIAPTVRERINLQVQRRRLNETPAQKQTRLQRSRERWYNILATETPEERELRKTHARTLRKARVEQISEADLVERREKYREWWRERQSKETEEEREKRLETRRGYLKKQIENETPRQREMRLERQKRYRERVKAREESGESEKIARKVERATRKADRSLKADDEASPNRVNPKSKRKTKS